MHNAAVSTLGGDREASARKGGGALQEGIWMQLLRIGYEQSGVELPDRGLAGICEKDGKQRVRR